jgi:hypothetical protein
MAERPALPPRGLEHDNAPFLLSYSSAQGALVRDETGTYLPDIDAARSEARLVAEEFSAEFERGGQDHSGSYFEIVSADGKQMITVPAFAKADG